MKAEKIILSFIAIFIGLLASGGAFYLYQSTKVIPKENKKIISVLNSLTPTPQDDNSFLSISEPKDEIVVSKRSVKIVGKTAKDATVIVSSEDRDQVAVPAADGSFTLTHTIGGSTTVINITAVFPDGTEKTIQKIITFSTENF